MKKSSVKISSIVFGLLFVAAGALLFAFNAGALPIEYKSVVFSLPMLLIAIGFIAFFSRRSWFAGLILILLGGFFLLPKLDIPSLDIIRQNGWAIILTAAGIGILCKVLFNRKWFQWHTHFVFAGSAGQEWKQFSSTGKRHKTGYIERNCVFGGAKEEWDVQNFKGGEVNCVFGGMELDLSKAQLAEGVHHLELNSVFGGIVLYVPIEWNIEINTTHVFGAFVDNRPKPGFEVDENRSLIIEANAIFGGGEIKCK